MAFLKNIVRIITGLSMLVSCQYENNVSGMSDGIGGNFLTTISSYYITDMTRSQADKKQEHVQNSELAVTVSEENWDSITKKTTRANVSGTDYTWEKIPNVALFIADSQNSSSCSFADIPLNPIDHLIFTRYYNPNDVNANFKNETGSKITGSSFFWKDWNHHSSMPTSANFYGYYPRPCDLVSSNVGLKYTPISILDRSEARSGSTNIKYTFMSSQNDENISYHDIMCSFSEDGKENEYYGNINKAENCNIQLRFKHMFCLLELEVNKGTYQGACQITDLKLSGKQVYTSGTLDIINCQTAPANGNSEIIRSFEPYTIEKDSPFKTTMIVQPTTDNASINNNDNERLVISCTINGAKYSCSLPNAKFEAGKKYKINLTLKPSEILDLQIWDGASVKVGDETFSKGDVTLTPRDVKVFYVTPNDENIEIKVLRNGEEINRSSVDGSTYMYALSMDAGKKTTYNIVTYPSNNNWYIIDGMRIHFDAIWNDKYSKDKQCTDITYWNDLSGHDNDGLLKSFGADNISGWNGTDGLLFDGIDDIVTFFGDIGTSEYTLEFFINMNPVSEQKSDYKEYYPFKRLIGEPETREEAFPAVYISGSEYIGFYGLGMDRTIGDAKFTFGKKTQYDIVYKDKKVNAYVNGEWKGTLELDKDAYKKQTASLGNRTMDNSRALKATYHSFIMYDKALNEDAIKQNYNINLQRFGDTK